MKAPMKKAMIIAVAAIALAAPSFAQDKTTLDYVTSKGTVVQANMQGQELALPMTYKADGTYVTSAMGREVTGKWRVDGEKLCTISAMGGGNENCIAYPAGKKPGDEFKVTNPMLGEVTVKINK